MASLKSLTVQTQPSGSGFIAAPTEANHVVRKNDLDQAVAPIAAISHSPLLVTSSNAITLSIPSGTQSLTASLRLKSASGLSVDSNGLGISFGLIAGTAVAGDVYATAIALKSDVGHTHAYGDIYGLSTVLSGKAAASHSHVIADISGLQAAIDSKADADADYSIDRITGLSAALSGKADSSHTHVIGDTTGLQSALDGKSASDHTHSVATDSAAGFMSAADKVKLGILSENTFWISPVGTKSGLPLNIVPVGACCIVLDTRSIYTCIATVGLLDDQWAVQDGPFVLKSVAGKYRFKTDGSFQLWNQTQSLFQSISLSGDSGSEVLGYGTGEA